MKKLFLLTILFTVCLFSAGCQKNEQSQQTTEQTLNIGYIDSDKVLRNWDKYKNFADKYYAEREQLVKDVSKDNKATNEDRIKVQLFDRKWNDERMQILEEVRTVGSKIAEEKKLDILLDNAETRPTIEYGGTDYTSEVLYRLRETK